MKLSALYAVKLLRRHLEILQTLMFQQNNNTEQKQIELTLSFLAEGVDLRSTS